jgi:hypothetical protein
MQLSKVKSKRTEDQHGQGNTCLDSLPAATQSLLLEGLEDYQSSQHLNNNDRK